MTEITIDLNNFKKEVQNDFSVIELTNSAEPYKLYHRIIRTKYFDRLFSEKRKEFQKVNIANQEFTPIITLEELWSFYMNNYTNLQTFYQVVEVEYYNNLSQKIRQGKFKLLSESEEDKINSLYEKFDKQQIITVLTEFKNQYQRLLDFFEHAELMDYFVCSESARKFSSFEIKLADTKESIIPFFVEKVYGNLNSFGNSAVQKLLVFIISYFLDIKVGKLAALVPKLNFLSKKSQIIRKIETFVFQKMFHKQFLQLIFGFQKLNEVIADHIYELSKIESDLYVRKEPLSFSEFEKKISLFDLKCEEIRKMKLPSQEKKKLTSKELCETFNLDLNSEIRKIELQNKFCQLEYDFEKPAEFLLDSSDNELTFEKNNLESEKKISDNHFDHDLNEFLENDQKNRLLKEKTTNGDVYINGFLVLE